MWLAMWMLVGALVCWLIGRARGIPVVGIVVGLIGGPLLGPLFMLLLTWGAKGVTERGSPDRPQPPP